MESTYRWCVPKIIEFKYCLLLEIALKIINEAMKKKKEVFRFAQCIVCFFLASQLAIHAQFDTMDNFWPSIFETIKISVVIVSDFAQ